jgi:hypothetical protein
MSFWEVGEIAKAKKLKMMIPLLFLCFILTACGDPKIGDLYLLKRTALGGVHIDSMENAIAEMRMMEELGDPDSMEENLNFGEITSFSVGAVVKVTGVNDQRQMVQIRNINPRTGDFVKMWIEMEELKEAVK